MSMVFRRHSARLYHHHMIETAENVWSDSCVAAMTDHDVASH